MTKRKMTKRPKKPKYYLKTYNMAKRACEERNTKSYLYSVKNSLHGIPRKIWKELREELHQPEARDDNWAVIKCGTATFSVPTVALTKLGKSCL